LFHIIQNYKKICLEGAIPIGGYSARNCQDIVTCPQEVAKKMNRLSSQPGAFDSSNLHEGSTRRLSVPAALDFHPSRVDGH